MSTPPNGGTTSPGNVTRITIRLTFTVECVAPSTYQVTPAKFIPVPNSETNIATKKKGNPGTRKSAFQLGADGWSEAISESREPLFGIWAKFSGNVGSGPRKCILSHRNRHIDARSQIHIGTISPMARFWLAPNKL